jgi:catalase
MEGFGVHTFLLINAKGESRFRRRAGVGISLLLPWSDAS